MVSEERIKTNLLLMDILDYWDEFTVKAINDEWTLRYYNIIMNLLNNQVDEAVKWLDSDDAKKLFFEEAEYQHELFRALEDQWDEILENKYPSIEALLQEVYNRGKAKGYAEMREHIKFSDTDKLALTFVRDYNFGLIRKIDKDTREQIKNTITASVIAGENPRSVAPKIMDTVGTRLTGSTFTPMQRAVMIARTEISRTQNTGILQSYVNEGYTEVKILTAEDDNVCYTCLTYAYEFNEDSPVIYANRGEEKVHNIMELLDGERFPPFHPNCRCTYLSVWETKGEPPKNPIIVHLIPKSFYDFEEGSGNLNEKINWTKETLKESLREIVDEEDLDYVADAIFDYLENKPTENYEYISAYDNEFNQKCRFYSKNKRRCVKLPSSVSDFAKKNGLGLAIHNHTSGVPFPSSDDINTGVINNKIKYNVICTDDNRIVLLVNSNISRLEHKYVPKKLINSISELHDLMGYEYRNSYERKEVLNRIEENPYLIKDRIVLLNNGYCDYVNKNFYKYSNILNKKFLSTGVSITEIKP